MPSKLLQTLSQPRVWSGALVLWAVTLFLLSTLSKTMPDGGPEIPHLDKILHFGYFFAGGFIFSSRLLVGDNQKLSPALRLLIVAIVFATIGALDEYHQTFTPGRSGNDPYDWLADLLGALAGSIAANAIHPLLRKRLS